MKKIITFLLVIFIITSVASNTVVWAVENKEPAIDVIFIMDLSNSMNNADREKVSLLSVAIFADLLSDSASQIGYVLFSDDVTKNMPLTPVEQAKSKIRNNVLTSEFSGWTNIPAALDNTLNLFTQSNSTNQKVAILFTDGKVELPNASESTNQQSEDRCREIAKTFKNAGIPLYTVGLNFNGYCDINFLQDLSDIASPIGMAARSYEAKTNWDIPEIFSKIFINVFNGNADVGLKFDSVDRTQTAVFYADEGIYELNVLLMHNQKLDNLVIRQPNNQIYQDATFQQRDSYSYVKIRYPDVGNWEFSFQGDIILANKLVNYVTDNAGTVTIAFDTDGGNVLPAQQVPIGNILHDVPIPTKEGFGFEGWYLNEARTRQLPDERTFSTDTILYAKWLPYVLRNITITGAGVTTLTYKVPEGDRFYNHMPDIPSQRKGYTFIGWTLFDGTMLDENLFITQDMTLTACWERVPLNLIPTIIFSIISAVIFLAGMILGKRLFNDSQRKSEYLCTGFSIIFTITFTLACWLFLTEYINPIEIQSTEYARESVLSVTFIDRINQFILFGGFLVPVLGNILLSGILPFRFVPPNAIFPKEKQYLIHLLITLVGLVWPTIIWILHGAGFTMIWLLGYAGVVYTINFFLSAFLFKQGDSLKCQRFFFDI